MPAFNVYGAADLAQLTQAYRDAEANILRLIAQALEKGAEGTGNYYKAQYTELVKLRRDADIELAAALKKSNQEIAGLLAANAQGAAIDAVPGVMLPAINTEAINALTLETAASLATMKNGVLRSVNDTFRTITRTVSTRGIMSGETMKGRLQAALNEYAAKGLTAYTDASGRQWKIDSYAEMALRTATNRAQNQGRAEQFKTYGISLVRTSQHMGCSDLCLPYQGKILSLDGRTGSVKEVDPTTGDTVTVTITATMDNAIANGYHHPNAVLGGDQPIDTWGKSQAGSKSFYRGPSVTIRTSEGNSLTVSPNHPVLTGRGWVTAETVRQGDNLFNAVKSRPSAVNIVCTPDLNNVETTVEDEFSSLKARLNTVLVPAAGHDFNDDRQFLEGEVSVVVPDGKLLPVPDAHIVQETGEVFFNWSDMRRRNMVSDGSELLSDSPVASTSAVFSPLLDVHPGSFQASAHSGVGNAETRGDLLSGEACFIQPNNINGVVEWSADVEVAGQNVGHFRAGDSRDVGDVIGGVPGGVESVDVVDVEFGYFEGHAYDFHTEDGIYSVNGLIIHNCRHTDTAYIPGTPDPEPIETDAEEAAAEQAQRYNERQIRAWKRREAVAITPQEKAKASAKVRQWQAQQREHLKRNPWLQRRYDREQIRAGVAGRATGLPEEVKLINPAAAKASAPAKTHARLLAEQAAPSTPVNDYVKATMDGFDPAGLKLFKSAKHGSNTMSIGKVKNKTQGVNLEDFHKPGMIRTPGSVNPNYGKDRGYGINCDRVAQAAELQARGYDVKAGHDSTRIERGRSKPFSYSYEQMQEFKQVRPREPMEDIMKGRVTPISNSDLSLATGWRTKDGKVRQFYRAQLKTAKSRNARTVKDMAQSVPDGARGFAACDWKGNNAGGHIWNWEKKDGKIQFFEFQSKRGRIPATEYLQDARDGTLQMVRMDDMVPTDEVLYVLGDPTV